MLGDDDWSCDQSKPCKTIWRAVTLASGGDHIYLDGTNTDKYPYTCQSRTSEHPGIYINKSLSLIGYGSSLPQIRCFQGTSLFFIGSENGQEMTVRLSGLFFNESAVRVQDFSVEIDDCTFKGSKQGFLFVITTNMASGIKITNSIFSRNQQCISVVVTGTKNPSQDTQVMFKLANSTFDRNIFSDEGTCISFTELPHSIHSASSDITLENVKFSRNKFSSNGLVFLKMDNGNQNVRLQNVIFIDNRPLSDAGRRDSTSSGDSECIIRSTGVNIIINSSNFTSEAARSFTVKGSNISLKIYNSRFSGHTVKGNGGAISLKGTSLDMLNVFNSSFVNTTAAQGGAINIECTNVYSVSFEDSCFKDNTAISGGGGAVCIHSTGSVLNDAEYLAKDMLKFHYNGQSSEKLPEINITKCDFNNANSSLDGGAVYINAVKASIRLRHSTFTNCITNRIGGAVFVTSISALKVHQSLFFNNTALRGGAISMPYSNSCNACHIAIERSTFSNNNAITGGAIYIRNAILTFQTVTMESNRAQYGGAVALYSFSVLNARDSQFFNNTALYNGGAFDVTNVDYNISVFVVQECYFDSNYVLGKLGSGGAIYVSNLHPAYFMSVLITNTTFNNCWSDGDGGAIFLGIQQGNARLKVKSSRFVDNYSMKHQGGAIIVYYDPDIPKDTGCNKTRFYQVSEIYNTKEFPSWVYKSNSTFEHTVFERNAADTGGALGLMNGKTIFRNCSFINNFASTLGGNIYIDVGSASLIVQDSDFHKTLNELQQKKIRYTRGSFIHAESSGALELNNTTMDASNYGNTGPFLEVRNGRLIDLGKNNLTTFNCPFGSQMDILHFTDQVTTQVNNKPCTIQVTTLQFICSPCAGNFYSLQRGHAFGLQLAPGFQCLPCPFGANCSQNIIAEQNYWGYKEHDSPPTLKFTMCPLGYCRPPQVKDFPAYNGCQGNRSGKLCGQCNEPYTETLYSTNCRPSHECKDYWFWPAELIYVSLMASYFTFNPPIVPWIKRQNMWFKQRKPMDEDKSFDSGYLKIVFYFYQAANLVLVSNSAQHMFKTKFIGPFVGLFNFEQRFSPSGLICPFPGLTVVTKQLLSTSHVLGTFLMIGVFFILHVGVKKFRSQEIPSAAPYIGGILQTMLLGYTALASVSFNLLRCVSIGSEKRLFHDGNIVCFQWWQYALIAFICAFFVPFVFVLCLGSFKLYIRTISVKKFLLACCLPLPCLLYWAYVSLSCKARSVTSQDSSSNQLSRNSVERVLYDCFKRPEDGGKLSLSWEGVMIGRRLILIVLKAFISDPMPRLLVMSFFCVSFLLQHAFTKPFRDGIANIVETFSLLSLVVLATVNVFFASFQSLAVPLNNHFSPWRNACQVVETIIVFSVPTVFCLLVVAAVLSQLCRLTFAVCRFLVQLLWVCFSWCRRKQDDDMRPLLA